MKFFLMSHNIFIPHLGSARFVSDGYEAAWPYFAHTGSHSQHLQERSSIILLRDNGGV